MSTPTPLPVTPVPAPVSGQSKKGLWAAFWRFMDPAVDPDSARRRVGWAVSAALVIFGLAIGLPGWWAPGVYSLTHHPLQVVITWLWVVPALVIALPLWAELSDTIEDTEDGRSIAVMLLGLVPLLAAVSIAAVTLRGQQWVILPALVVAISTELGLRAGTWLAARAGQARRFIGGPQPISAEGAVIGALMGIVAFYGYWGSYAPLLLETWAGRGLVLSIPVVAFGRWLEARARAYVRPECTDGMLGAQAQLVTRTFGVTLGLAVSLGLTWAESTHLLS